MKSFVFIFIFLFSTLSVGVGFAETYVRGYTKKDGTYVEPHYRSSPDNNPYNNYSTKGNTNPYTGKKGTKNPDQYNQYNNYNQNKKRY